jgi:hypothetical protein
LKTKDYIKVAKYYEVSIWPESKCKDNPQNYFLIKYFVLFKWFKRRRYLEVPTSTVTDGYFYITVKQLRINLKIKKGEKNKNINAKMSRNYYTDRDQACSSVSRIFFFFYIFPLILQKYIVWKNICKTIYLSSWGTVAGTYRRAPRC